MGAMRARLRSASLLLALAAGACGDVRTLSPDATALDATADAPAAGTVTIEIYNLFGNEGPLEGTDVIVVTPEGTLVGEATTDGDGRASIDDVPGGSILLFFPAAPDAPEHLVVAIYDVQPGDEIVFTDEESQGDSLGNMTVVLPVHGEAGTYHVSNGCSEASGSDPSGIGLPFYPGCVIEDEADMLAWVTDASEQVVAFLHARRPFAAAMPMDLQDVPWQEPDTLDVKLTSVPPEARRLDMTSDQMLDRRRYGALYQTDLLDLPDPDFETSAARPASFGDSTIVTFDFMANQSSLGAQQLQARVDGDNDELEIDLSSTLLPWYSTPAYDVGQKKMIWSRTDGHEPDGHFLLFTWSDEGGGGTQGIWYTISPPGWTELPLPALPPPWDEELPQDPGPINALILAVESSAVDGWDATRQLGIGLVLEDALHAAPPGTTILRSSAPGDN